MKYIYFSLVFLLFIFLTSCASILNGEFQPVDIIHQEGTEVEVLVDNEIPHIHKEKNSLLRDELPKQVTIQREGYKPEHKVVYQHKKSWWYALSVIPFGVLYFPLLWDDASTAFNYPKEIVFEEQLLKLPENKNNYKHIFVDEVNISASHHENEDGKYYRSLGRYLNNRTSRYRGAHFPDFRYTNTDPMVNSLNEIFRDGGFMDTTSTILKYSYINDLILSVDVQDVKHHMVEQHFSFVDITANWSLSNIYGEPVFSSTTDTRSGEFIVPRAYYTRRSLRTSGSQTPGLYTGGSLNEFIEKRNQAIHYSIYQSIKDAMEKGLIVFLEKEEVLEVLSDKSALKKEAELEAISLNSPSFPAKALNETLEGVVLIKTEEKGGSGFFINEMGYIVTNYNRIANSDEIEVVVSDGSSHSAKVIRKSKLNDLALLKIDAENLDIRPLALNAEIPGVGTPIFAIGSPLSEELSQSVSRGIISAVRKNPGGSEIIQTDASINTGNNGGPMTNENGEVIGIVLGSIRSLSIDGIGFAIPSALILDKLKIELKDQSVKN